MVAHHAKQRFNYTKMRMSSRFVLADIDWNIVATPETKKILVFEDAEHAMMYAITSGTFENPESFYMIRLTQELWNKVEQSNEYILMEKVA